MTKPATQTAQDTRATGSISCHEKPISRIFCDAVAAMIVSEKIHASSDQSRSFGAHRRARG